MADNWKSEIIKKVPWSATFLLASFLFFKFTDERLAAWVCIGVAVIALFLLIKFEYYEKIIERQEKHIRQYSKQALNSHINASKAISDMNTTLANVGAYSNESENETKTS